MISGELNSTNTVEIKLMTDLKKKQINTALKKSTFTSFILEKLLLYQFDYSTFNFNAILDNTEG